MCSLDSIPSVQMNGYKKWCFIGDSGKLYNLQHSLGTNLYHVQIGSGCFEIVADIDSFVAQNIDFIEKSKSNCDENEKLIESVRNLIGPHNGYINCEFAWKYTTPNLHLRFYIHLYKDNSVKQICFQTRKNDNEQWSSKFVSSQQLLNFLQKNKNAIASRGKKSTNTTDNQLLAISSQLGQMSLNKDPSVNCLEKDMKGLSLKPKVAPNHLFISIPKEKRISIQSCKPTADPYMFLESIGNCERNTM
jgi:hypothetical protein